MVKDGVEKTGQVDLLDTADFNETEEIKVDVQQGELKVCGGQKQEVDLLDDLLGSDNVPKMKEETKPVVNQTTDDLLGDLLGSPIKTTTTVANSDVDDILGMGTGNSNVNVTKNTSDDLFDDFMGPSMSTPKSALA